MFSKRAGVAAIAATLSIGMLSACGVNDKRDLEGVSSVDPDYAEVYNNTDERPNVQLLCIRGVGFSSTTREYAALNRVPEWDEFCKQFPQSKIQNRQYRKNGGK